MNDPPAWQCYAQDFLIDVQEWDDTAVGIYFRFLNYQWVNRDLPPDIVDLVSLCNSDIKTLEKHWNKYIKDKFLINERSRLYNNRLEEYWQELMGKRSKCSIAGKASAKKRRR